MWEKIVKASEVVVLSMVSFVGVFLFSLLTYVVALWIICPTNMNSAPVWPVLIIAAVLMVPTEVLLMHTLINQCWACEKKGK